jgi:hypothetical protein
MFFLPLFVYSDELNLSSTDFLKTFALALPYQMKRRSFMKNVEGMYLKE